MQGHANPHLQNWGEQGRALAASFLHDGARPACGKLAAGATSMPGRGAVSRRRAVLDDRAQSVADLQNIGATAVAEERHDGS